MKSMKNKRSLQASRSRSEDEAKKAQTIHHLYPETSNQIKEKINKYNINIQKAFHKYDSLNQGYKIETQQKNQDIIEDYESKKKNKIKFNPNQAMAKLRHLESKSQIERVEQELSKRTMVKSYRHNRHWKYIEKALKTSYITTYRNFLKERIQNFKEEEEEEKERSKSSENFSLQKYGDIQFSKELKKHPAILDYTKKKMEEKKRFFQSKTKEAIKAKSLQEMASMRNKKLESDYQKMQENTVEIAESKSIELQKTNAIVQKKMVKMFNKKQKYRLSEEMMNNKRCKSFFDRQTNIYMKKQNDSICKENKAKMKEKFASIIIQLSKAQSKMLSPSNKDESFISGQKSPKQTRSLMVSPRKKFQSLSLQLSADLAQKN